MFKKSGLAYVSSFLLTVCFLSNINFSSYCMKNCFYNSRANFLKINVEGHCYVNTIINPYTYSEKVLKTYNSPIITNKSQSNGCLQIDFNSGKSKCTLNITKLSCGNKFYISLSESQDSNIENINNIYSTISSVFESLNLNVSFSTLIEGKYNGKVSQGNMKRIALSCIRSVGGNYVEGFEEKNMISYCGYTPAIKEKVLCRNKSININIAMRYSESSNCTYIWIADPIITVEY